MLRLPNNHCFESRFERSRRLSSIIYVFPPPTSIYYNSIPMKMRKSEKREKHENRKFKKLVLVMWYEICYNVSNSGGDDVAA